MNAKAIVIQINEYAVEGEREGAVSRMLERLARVVIPVSLVIFLEDLVTLRIDEGKSKGEIKTVTRERWKPMVKSEADKALDAVNASINKLASDMRARFKRLFMPDPKDPQLALAFRSLQVEKDSSFKNYSFKRLEARLAFWKIGLYCLSKR